MFVAVAEELSTKTRLRSKGESVESQRTRSVRRESPAVSGAFSLCAWRGEDGATPTPKPPAIGFREPNASPRACASSLACSSLQHRLFGDHTAQNEGVSIFHQPLQFFSLFDLCRLGQCRREIYIVGFCRRSLNALDFDFMAHIFLPM